MYELNEVKYYELSLLLILWSLYVLYSILKDWVLHI
jgi:hypothetical protein